MIIEESRQSYLLAKELQGISETTYNAYEQSTSKLSKYLGAVDIDDVTANDIRTYLNGLTQCGNVTKGIYIKHYRTWFNWLENEGLITDNPMRNIPNPKVKSKLTKRVLTMEEAEKLLKASLNQPRNFAIISLMLGTGLRVSELCDLTLDDIDWENRIIYVKDGKGGKDRKVYFNHFIGEAVKRYLIHRPDTTSKSLFISWKTHNRMDRCAVGRMIKRLGEKTGVGDIKQVCPHALRHTFATQWFCNQGDPHSLQSIMGWSTTRMADKYVHLAATNVQEAYNRCSPMNNLGG
jgi:site-specific recombinase XerD